MPRRILRQEAPGTNQQTVDILPPVRPLGLEAAISDAAAMEQQSIDWMDTSAKRAGIKAGGLAGLNPNFKETGGFSIYDQSFDAAGVKSYVESVTNKARTDMFDLYQKNKQDPQALKTALDNYREGVMSGMNETAPDAAPVVEGSLQRLQEPFMETSINAAAEHTRQSQRTSAQASIESIFDASMFAAKNMTDRAKMIATTGANRAELEKLLLTNGPKDAFTDNKTTFIGPDARKLYGTDQPSALRTGAFTTDEIQQVLKHYDDSLKTAQAVYGFTQAAKLGSGLTYIEKWMASKQKDPVLQQHITSVLFQQLGENQRLAADAFAIQQRERTLRHQQGEQVLTDLQLKGELTPDILEMAARNDFAPMDTITKMEKAASEHGPMYSDAQHLQMYSMDLGGFTEAEIANDNTLTHEDRIKLIDERRKQLGDGNDWRNSQQGREGVRRIKDLFPKTEFGFLQPAVTKAAGDMLTTYYNRVSALPPDQRETKAIDIANELVREKKIGDLVKQRQSYENQLADPKITGGFTSPEAVDAAAARGDPLVSSTYLGVTFKHDKVIEMYKSAIGQLQAKIAQLDAQIKAEGGK